MLQILLRALCVTLPLLAAAVDAAPRAELWERWTAHDPQSMRQIDHSAWEKFLMRYVRIGKDGVDRVAYGNVARADREALDAYIGQLARVPVSRYDRAEQLAYWINLYNALVVQLVLDHYPLPGMRVLAAGSQPWTSGPWAERRVEIEGTPVSLNDIEHRILRPIWRDPRVHYALSCAALGCPNLQPEPFQADRLERQLNQAAMAYINDPRCIRIEGQRLMVSSLFRWYQEDFGGTDRDIINHLMAYAEPGLAMRLQKFVRINGDDLDWRLNDATP